MLEKTPGIPRIHRLRIIQIIEEDLNQCLLLLFTKPMVQMLKNSAYYIPHNGPLETKTAPQQY